VVAGSFFGGASARTSAPNRLQPFLLEVLPELAVVHDDKCTDHGCAFAVSLWIGTSQAAGFVAAKVATVSVRISWNAAPPIKAMNMAVAQISAKLLFTLMRRLSRFAVFRFSESRVKTSMNSLLSVHEVADLLGVSAAWVYQHSCGARRPSLPSVKLGRAVRFRLEAIQEFVCQMERCGFQQ